MHAKRWLTAVIAVPCLIYVIGVGPRWLFHILLLVVALRGLIEFYRFTSPELPRPVRWVIYTVSFGVFLLTSGGNQSVIPVAAFLWAVMPMVCSMLTYQPGAGHSTDSLGKAALAPFYVCLPLILLMMMDRFPGGRLWVFFLLSVVFASDTGAFYIGRILGKHKLHPSVSPGKTWEGAIGGLVLSTLIACVWIRYSTLHPSGWQIVVLALLLSSASQVGDLVESMLKRNHQVKDSGRILPGHGGVLDRIDGLLFSIPVQYVFLSWSVP